MNRRLFLERIVKGLAVTGLAFLSWPFLRSWVPEFGKQLVRDVSVADLGPGEMKFVHWLGRNVIVLRRSREMLSELARAEALKDPKSRESTQPGFATNAFRSLRPEYFVAFNNCTHLGCEIALDEPGFKCPCHQSEYDFAGRVKEASVAPKNLEIPNYRFISGNLIRLEEEQA